MSIRGILIWVLTCTAITVLFPFIGAINSGQPPSESGLNWLFLPRTMTMGLIVGLIDYSFLVLSRIFLKRLTHSKGLVDAVLFVIYSLAVTYIMLILYLTLENAADATSDLLTGNVHAEAFSIALVEFDAPIWVFYKTPLALGALVTLVCSPSSVIFAAIVAGSIFLYLTRSVLKPVTSWIIEQLSSSRHGALSAGAAFLAAASTVFANLNQLLSIHQTK